MAHGLRHFAPDQFLRNLSAPLGYGFAATAIASRWRHTPVALLLFFILDQRRPGPTGCRMSEYQRTERSAPKYGVLKVIDFREHYLEFDPQTQSRTWHQDRDMCTPITDRGSAIRLAKSAGGLVVELSTGQFELPEMGAN